MQQSVVGTSPGIYASSVAQGISRGHVTSFTRKFSSTTDAHQELVRQIYLYQ